MEILLLGRKTLTQVLLLILNPWGITSDDLEFGYGYSPGVNVMLG
jgi:hypothetical protein